MKGNVVVLVMEPITVDVVRTRSAPIAKAPSYKIG